LAGPTARRLPADHPEMKKSILVVGGGGREHALAWKLASSPRVGRVYCAPGNAGTRTVAENVPIPISEIPAIVDFSKKEGIGLVVIGPDDALAAGMADALMEAGIPVFGPTREAARLESSKAFAKDFMHRHGIPTAAAREFTNSKDARAACRSSQYPLVVKADGLALGKGVTIATSPKEADEAIRLAMDERIFGEAGGKILLEECLVGTECSIHAIIDRSGYCLFPDARDHKRAWEGDRGPNTGGMGTISPAGLPERMVSRVREEILDRFIRGLEADGITFRGMLFPGLILTADGPKVLEFNCRFGDPETQVLLPRLKSDLLDLLETATEDRIADASPEWDARSACCVILASSGYPGPYRKGLPVHGLEDAARTGAHIFHAGTGLLNGQTITTGGRVLGVTALGTTAKTARTAAYAAADHIHFDGLFRREDIGKQLT
jgi:phosphoribosylamine---glycine ligase